MLPALDGVVALVLAFRMMPHPPAARTRVALDWVGMTLTCTSLGGLVYVVAIVVAVASPWASFGIDAAVAAYFALSRSEVPGLLVGTTPESD